MKKCLIVYYSQGGTTDKVAKKIATGLHAAEYQTDLYNIKEKSPPETVGYDLLGIGSPTYYFRPPFNVTDYLNSLPKLDGLPTFVFTLHGTYQGDCGNIIRHALVQKEAQDVGYFHCHGADYFYGYLKEGYLFSPDSPTAGELAQAEDFGREIADRVEGKGYTRTPDDPHPGIVYRLERFLVNRWLCNQVYSRFFSLNREECSSCGLCIQECPTENISEGKNQYPAWGRNCLACLTCEMICPDNAITSVIDWQIFLPTLKYNISHASRDPTLEYVRVIHHQGQTQRL